MLIYGDSFLVGLLVVGFVCGLGCLFLFDA